MKQKYGFLPRAGANLDVDGVHITVRRTSKKRVEEVLLERSQEAEEVGA